VFSIVACLGSTICLAVFPLDVQIGAGQVAEAIEWGRSRVVPLVGGDGGAGGPAAASDRELLEDATALLAYDDPATGPTGARNKEGGIRMCNGPCSWGPA
jgi:hypothetical protein